MKNNLIKIFIVCLLLVSAVTAYGQSTGRVTTNPPTYTNNTIAPMSLRTDGSQRMYVTGGTITAAGDSNSERIHLKVVVENTVPVSGTFWQATQPVLAASLPLPSGASTEATLSTLNGKIPSSLTVSSLRLLVDASQSIVSLTSGSQLIGKVGIDQTTPGTTNRVSLGSDIVPVSGSVAVTSVGAGANGIGSVFITPPTVRTYSCAFQVTAAATPTDIFQLIGSASTTVKITNIRVSTFISNSGSPITLVIAKRSTANTGGTSSAAVMVPRISTDAAATAVGSIYTANPTTGTLVGNIRMMYGEAGLAYNGIGNNVSIFNWSLSSNFLESKPITLIGVAQTLVINFAGSAAATSQVFNVNVDFTEE